MDNIAVSPKRMQRKRQRGWRMPPNSVYIGRGSAFGNPYRVCGLPGKKWNVRIASPKSLRDVDTAINVMMKTAQLEYDTRREAAQAAVDCFTVWLTETAEGRQMFCRIKELQGMNLLCWCEEEDPCHGDVLLKIANM